MFSLKNKQSYCNWENFKIITHFWMDSLVLKVFFSSSPYYSILSIVYFAIFSSIFASSIEKKSAHNWWIFNENVLKEKNLSLNFIKRYWKRDSWFLFLHKIVTLKLEGKRLFQVHWRRLLGMFLGWSWLAVILFRYLIGKGNLICFFKKKDDQFSIWQFCYCMI